LFWTKHNVEFLEERTPIRFYLAQNGTGARRPTTIKRCGFPLEQVETEVTLESSEGWSTESLNKLASNGAIFGIIAAALGLILSGGNSLVPIPGTPRDVLHEIVYFVPAAAFLGLLAVSLIFQIRGIRKLKVMLASGIPNVIYGPIVMGIITAIYLVYGGFLYTVPGLIDIWTVNLMIFGALFTIFWQIMAFVYADALKSWQGYLTGLLNALFIPLVVIGQVFSPLIVYPAYGVLLVGQVLAFLFWRDPENQVREFTRSSDVAKIGYNFTGILTFIIGSFAVFVGPLSLIEGALVWSPWGILASQTMYQTNPAFIYAFCAMLLFWIFSYPRLGAKELKFEHVRKGVLSSGLKYFLAFLASFGIFIAGQAGSEIVGVVTTYNLLITMIPCSILVLIGSMYVSNADIITGLPLLFSGSVMLIFSHSIALLVVIPWIGILITQIFLLVESKVRAFLSFEQGFLVLISIFITSILFVLILLGGFGSGPASLWPTNKWFNIALFPGIPIAAQAATILVLPTIILLIRNMAIAGFAHLQGDSGGVIVGMSFIFAIMIPLIAGSDVVTHQANIGAAVLLALYTISFVLVLSFNLNLAGDLEEIGRAFEGAYIRTVTIAGMIFGAIVMVIVLGTFAQFSIEPVDIANVITLLVTFVVGLEVLLDVGWVLGGIRLGIFKKGFKFTKMEEAVATAPTAL
jgi:hypothetical protein